MKTVHDWIHVGEGFEVGVVDAVAECDIDEREGDCGIKEVELEGLDEDVEGGGANGHALLIDLGLGVVAIVAGQSADACSSAQEYVGAVCLR